ncbi:unnamed protein product [Cylindrotheca closterium]|uniref:FH2 domain-containing protein n=1 Tax=Cylindrotheca closterium TaxID=2856 RepID=A0AAD2PUN0_9STRA|nr:unnamed protein product [Cylindrotheca closterium]
MKLFRSPSTKQAAADSSSSSAQSQSNSQKSPRRRNFRFLRSVDQKRRESVSTQKRARAHAKELAMAYNLGPASDTPNSTTSSNVNLLSRADVATPSPRAQQDDFFDPFGNGAPQQQQQQQHNSDPFANASVEEDLFAIHRPPEIKSSLDQHFAEGPNDFRSKEPTASTIDSFDHSSIGSDLDLFANSNNNNSNGKPAKLDDFMGRQQQRGRNVVANPGGINAIARRKMRSQSHKRQVSDSNTSVASNTSQEEQHHHQQQYSSPPASPRGIQRAAIQNRKASYGGKHGMSSGGSVAGGSVAGSVMTTTTFQSQSSFMSSGSVAEGDPNLWDSNRDGGFTFDAFGLDESQVQQDVDNAVQELVTQGHRGFSFFQNDGAGSDNDSEFQAGPWDSPNTSRMSIASVSSDTDGFDDGFRTQPQHGGGRPRSPTPPMRGQTPPRWEKNRKGSNTRGAGFADFDNPWKHDSSFGGSASKPPAAGSEIGGSSSVFGGTKSEFMPSSSSPFQAGGNFTSSLFASNASDQGGSGPGYLGRLKTKRPDGDTDDEMQDDLAKEFAQEFVKRISPRHNVASPTSERSFGDFSEQSSYTEYDDDHSEFDEQQQQHDVPPTTRAAPKSKFGNFRDRYESSKVEVAAPSTPGQSYRTLAAQKEQQGTTDQGGKPSYGSLRSSYNAAKATTSGASEEKKEDEDGASSAAGTSKRGTLKAKWQKFENKSRPPVTTTRPPVDDDEVSVRALSSDTPRHAGRSSQGFGRKSDINKSAFSRLREESFSHSEPPTPSLQNVTLRRTPSRSKLEDLMDDESVMQNAATPSPSTTSRPVSYRQQSSADSGHSRPTTPVAGEDEPPVERKLTYREKRELELRKEAEQQAKSQQVQKQDTPKKDVAAMIRRRIAANKAKAAQEAKQQNNEVADFRSRLKPTKSSSPEKPAEESTTSTTVSPEKEAQAQAQIPAIPEQAEQDLPPRPSIGSPSPLNEFMQQGNSQKKGSLLDHETVVSLQAENADLVARLKALEQKLAEQDSPAADKSGAPSIDTDSAQDQHKMLGGMLAKRLSPTAKASSSNGPVDTKKVLGNMLAARGAPACESDGPQDPKKMLGAMLAGRAAPAASSDAPQDPKKMLGAMLAGRAAPHGASSSAPQDPKKMLGAMLAGRAAPPGGDSAAPQDPKKMLGGLLAKRAGLPPPPKEGGAEAADAPSGRPALKNDPKYEKYFKMMKVGMPKEMVKHAMQRDGLDPDILDADPNQPAGLPLKEDPKYQKYFKMLKIGIPMGQVKHSIERDGLNPDVMDQDHNLPASAAEKKLKKKKIPKIKDTHRRARLHWNTMTKVVRGSIWGKIQTDDTLSCIDIDEDEFKDLFQAEIGQKDETPKMDKVAKKGPAVRVIDAKRANNGGIILARIKMSHDEMAEAVDRMDSSSFSSSQIESIIEYLPTKDERDSLEQYMIDGGQDAAAKFNGLCECEKFMVSMMTVKHAKRKINALLFKLQFDNCLESITVDADMIDHACEELKNSSRLRQLLGIVLQFGNRLNTAGSGEKNKAGAFTLDSLLKLNQAKAFDKKTTFLHYIVLIVQRNNELLLTFDDDIQGVLKAERVYWDQCVSDLEDVENQLENVRRISLHEAKKKAGHRTPKKKDDDDDSIIDDKAMSLEEEVAALRSTQTGLFTLSAIKQVSTLRDKVDKTVVKFDKLLEYFGEHESGSKKQPHELFAIFSKFARDFKKAREEVARQQKKKQREERKKQKAMGNNPSKPNHVGNDNRSIPRTHRTESVSQAAAAAAANRTTGERSSTIPDAKSSAKASFRDQARHSRLRQVQTNVTSHNSGTSSQPLASNRNTESVPSNRPPPLAPSPSDEGYNPAGTPSAKPPMSSTTTPTGSRNLMRNRRRLMEERKKRSTPTDTSSPWRSPQTAS